MHVIIPKASLVKLLGRVRGACDPKSPLPALHAVILTAGEGALRGSGTDLYRASQASAAADVGIAGSVAVDAADLESRVKAMPEGPIELTVAGDSATVKAVGKPRKFSMSALPRDSFPSLPQAGSEPVTLTLQAATLARLASSVMPAASPDTTRAHINGALLAWSPGAVRMVATDGNRMALCDASREGDGSGEVLIPLSALTELRKLCDGAEGGVPFTVGQPWIFAAVDSATFAFKQVASQFPPYQQVIPADDGSGFKVHRGELVDMLRAVALSAGDASGAGVKMTFTPGLVRVTAESSAKGAGSDEMACGYAGAGLTIAVNASFLVTALGGCDADEVTLSVANDLAPVVVRGDGFVGVVMPMRM